MTDQRFNWEDGFELLRNANQYLRFCVGVNTPREEAQARFDARAIIIRLEHEVLDEAESRLPMTEQHIGDIAEKHGLMIREWIVDDQGDPGCYVDVVDPRAVVAIHEATEELHEELAQARALLPCGHPMSLVVTCMECTGTYCKRCVCQIGRDDALRMEEHWKQRAEAAEVLLRRISRDVRLPRGGCDTEGHIIEQIDEYFGSTLSQPEAKETKI